MRKKERYTTQAATIGFCVTALGDLLIQWLEHHERGEKFTWNSYDGSRTLKNAMYGVAIGAGIGCSLYDLSSALNRSKYFNSNEYLKAILKNRDLKNNSDLYQNAILVRDKLKIQLLEIFEHALVSVPENTGSFVRSTANIGSYDIDILLPFRKRSFSSLEEMFIYTFEKIKSKLNHQQNVSVYKKTKSIGISFERDGDEIFFDIVPGREIGDYKLDNKLNLFVNSNSLWKRNGSFKIDTSLQRKITNNRPNERKIIRLLKMYNSENNLNIPKVIIEQSVVLALSDDNFGLFSSITDNLLNSMLFLSDILGKSQFVDWGNSSNNLLLKMSSTERNNAIVTLRNDVEMIEYNEHYLKDVFENVIIS